MASEGRADTLRSTIEQHAIGTNIPYLQERNDEGTDEFLFVTLVLIIDGHAQDIKDITNITIEHQARAVVSLAPLKKVHAVFWQPAAMALSYNCRVSFQTGLTFFWIVRVRWRLLPSSHTTNGSDVPADIPESPSNDMS